MEIVIGYHGEEHVTAGQLGRIVAGLAGTGSYVLGTQDKLAATMKTANQIEIATGDIVINGRAATVETPELLTVDSGATGQKRNDLVVARYEKDDSSSVESVSLKVVKGTPVDYGDPVDPEIEDGSILDQDSPVEVPLWRIPIDGLAPGTPVKLFDETSPLSELRESLSQKLLWRGTYAGGQTIEVPGIGDYDVLSFAMSIGFTTFPVVCTRAEPGSAAFMGCSPFFSSGQVIYLLYVAVTAQGDELSSTAANISYMRLNPNDWAHDVTTGATITRIVGIS